MPSVVVVLSTYGLLLPRLETTGVVLVVDRAVGTVLTVDNEIVLVRGDSASIPIRIERPLGTPLILDPTPTLWFTVKRLLSDADVAAILQKTSDLGDIVVSDQEDAPGELNVVLVPEDTETVMPLRPRTPSETLYWDLQMEEASGNVSTPLHGVLTLIYDVTRARNP